MPFSYLKMLMSFNTRLICVCKKKLHKKVVGFSNTGVSFFAFKMDGENKNFD